LEGFFDRTGGILAQSVEPTSAELVEKVFRELDRPNSDFLD
jgi:hypothetical protein